MDLTQVLTSEDISAKIESLKNGRVTKLPDVKLYKDELDVMKHAVMNPALRQDKWVIVSKIDEQTGQEKVIRRQELVSRVSLSLQELIVKRAVSFLFGNEVKLTPAETDATSEKIMAAIARVNKDNKINSFNKIIASILFSCTEVAEYWYVADTDTNNNYGFSTNKKIKCAVFSPFNGDELYPYFDEYGDLIAFSRAYEMKTDATTTINMFETWTADKYLRWKQNGSTWEEVKADTIPVQLGKIPIVYGNQKHVEWYKVQPLIDRLEKLLSNFADTNDYFASPILFITNGETMSISPKNDAGKVMTADGEADAKYLAWSAVPEPIKLEIDNLLRFIFSFTQTPDISFESVKGLGTNLSGETLKMLFLDAHLKVEDKKEIFDSYLTRRYNIVKALIGALNTSLKTAAAQLDIDNIIEPYMVNLDTTTIDNLVAAYSAGIISKETAVQNNPFVEDAAQEMERINEEGNSPDALDKQQNS